jgi:hypothetical protein
MGGYHLQRGSTSRVLLDLVFDMGRDRDSAIASSDGDEDTWRNLFQQQRTLLG